MADGKKNKKTAKSKQGKDSKNMTASSILQNNQKFKVRLPIKLTVIFLSVLALSWFFEGLRQIQKGFTLAHALVFLGGIISTAILLWVQGFWIYLEEKYKGTLRKKIEHFDKLEAYWQRKKNRND
jgi:hypothetical protein